MAEKTVVVEDLELNTRGSDMLGAGVSVTTSDTFTIDVQNVTHDLIIVIEEGGVGAATVTFDAGANPPSLQAPLGDLEVALATSDIRPVPLEGGRFIQTNGKITGSVATNTVTMRAYRLPKGM